MLDPLGREVGDRLGPLALLGGWLRHGENRIKVRHRGAEWWICARCGGMAAGLLIFLPVFAALAGLRVFRAGGAAGTALVAVLGLPACAHWIAVRGVGRFEPRPGVTWLDVVRIRDGLGDNRVRLATGFGLGVALAVFGTADFHPAAKFATALVFAAVASVAARAPRELPRR